MSLARILIVEDDREIAQLIEKALSREGYEMDTAQDGILAWEKIAQNMYDLVILDLMLPRMDGWEVLRRLRQEKNIPVLILSARAEESDKILGLGLGADDYLTKPFRVGELIARVKAQLRRYLYMQSEENSINSTVLSHQGLQLNRDTCEVVVNDQMIALTAKEFRILELLMQHPQRVFSKEHIFQRVWGDDFLSDDNTVMVHIRRLRSKIEPDPSNPIHIHTVWGIGYRMGKGPK